MDQATSWVETISYREAMRRSEELAARARQVRERLMSEGNDWRYAEQATVIPIVHPGAPPFHPAKK